MYSTSAVLRATHDCFLQDQETNAFSRMWQVSLMLFLSVLRPAKSESEPKISKLSILKKPDTVIQRSKGQRNLEPLTFKSKVVRKPVSKDFWIYVSEKFIN